MSQAEIVKSPIISIVRAPLDGAKSNGAGARPSEAITTFAWNTSPTAIVEEVDLPAQLDPRLVTLSEPASARAQSFRLLEHRLVAKGNPRVIAVNSAEPS